MKEQLDSKSPTTTAAFEVWIKASDSDSGGNCVELSFNENTIKFRDSKDPHGPQLIFTRAEFESFKHGVRHGEFDQ